MRILEKDNEIYKVPREMMKIAGAQELLRRSLQGIIFKIENRERYDDFCGAAGINGYKVSNAPDDVLGAPYIPADTTPLVGNYSSTTISERYGK